MLLALLLEDYNATSATQLLEKDDTIGLVRRLHILAGGTVNVHQLEFDHANTGRENVNLYGSLVGVTGSNHFENIDLQAMLSALSRSKAINDEDILALDISELISQMMTFLPIGLQSDLV